jgi:hypothetical protein
MFLQLALPRIDVLDNNNIPSQDHIQTILHGKVVISEIMKQQALLQRALLFKGTKLILTLRGKVNPNSIIQIWVFAK